MPKTREEIEAQIDDLTKKVNTIFDFVSEIKTEAEKQEKEPEKQEVKNEKKDFLSEIFS